MLAQDRRWEEPGQRPPPTAACSSGSATPGGGRQRSGGASRGASLGVARPQEPGMRTPCLRDRCSGRCVWPPRLAISTGRQDESLASVECWHQICDRRRSLSQPGAQVRTPRGHGPGLTTVLPCPGGGCRWRPAYRDPLRCQDSAPPAGRTGVRPQSGKCPAAA